MIIRQVRADFFYWD